MKNVIALLSLVFAISSASAAVPSGGLICKAHSASGQSELKEFMWNRLISVYFYPQQGGFTYDSTGTLKMRSVNGLATFCVDGDSLGADVMCAPWGSEARLVYHRSTPGSAAGVGQIQIIDKNLPGGNIALDCREY
ncbi:MAG: hypothetical protein ACXVA9_08240 [Bdellovibrionales bacterium]